VGDRGDDLGRWPVAHGLQHGRDRLEGGEAPDQLGKQRHLAGKQPVQGGAGDPGLGGQLVHGQLGQAVAADQVQGGVEDAAAQLGRRLKAEFLQQVLLAAEQAVQGGAGHSGLGGQLVHGQLGQAAAVVVVAVPLLVAGLPGCGDGCQDLLLGDRRHRHEIILDEM
jgi:hypothetical protein